MKKLQKKSMKKIKKGGPIMTEKEKKELLNALNLIKKICKEHDCDNDCPCYCCGDCMVHINWPNEWNLVEEQSTWKAFNR